MGASKDIIDDLKKELKSKIEQRETILDQLQLLDVSIDKYDTILKNMDREVLELTKPINDVANEVKAAYDARISADCRTRLVWKLLSTTQVRSTLSGGIGFISVSLYEVVINESTESFTPYDGIKYYQKPSNRDYGSAIVSEFSGNISQGSSVIAVNIPNQSVLNPLSGIKIGDTITDSLDSPTIFNLGNLPTVTGFGKTESIGIVTSLVGGIFTSGVTFFQFGSGLLDEVQEGMLLLHPGVPSETGQIVPVLQENTTIVGFGTGEYPVQYFDENGDLVSSTIPCNTVTIDKPALRVLDEGEFTVGIVTTFDAIFISTTGNQNATGAQFIAIRTDDRDAIDADFDPTSSPNSPVKIGSIGKGSFGIGSSVFYDFSGNPSETQKWRPENARDEVRTGKNQDIIVIEEVKEPLVGAGAALYNIGTTQWPTKTISTLQGGSVSYASLGTKVRASPGSISVSYASQPPGGFPSNCGQLSNAISNAESQYSNIVSSNRSSAQRIVEQTASLRKERDKKERRAYSLLQASSSLRADIAELRTTLRKLDGVDFSPYEKR
jgi:hypothetical protein